LLPRHRTPSVVEKGCGIGPIAANGLDRRLVACELTADQPIIWLAFSLLAMTCRAFLCVDDGSLRGSAISWRQSTAVRRYADVPGRRVLKRNRLSEPLSFGSYGGP
jgi:hypothetical protein